MAENNDQRPGSAKILDPVPNMSGPTDSTPDRRHSANHPQRGDKAPGRVGSTTTHRNVNAISERNPVPERSLTLRDSAVRTDGSQPGEHASTTLGPQKSLDARLPSPGPGSEWVEMKNAKSHGASSRVKGQIKEVSTNWEERYRSTKGRLDEAQNHIARQNKDLDEMRRRCQRGDQELRKLRELLKHRTEEVKVAQAFMTTADKYSTAEVSRMVEEVNDEIYQCSMYLSDAMLGQAVLPKDFTPDGDARKCLENAQKLFSRWNQDFVKRLRADLSRHDPDTTLFDCVTQYALADWTHGIIRSFCQQDKKADQYLTKLWESVAASHEPSISRNWLAITRATLKSQGQPLDRAVIMERLTHLMAVSGREALPANRLGEVIGGRLDQVASKALRVKEAIAEGVVSADLQVFFCVMNAEFQPPAMRNAWENTGKSRRSGNLAEVDRVVCSTGLGLCRIIRESRTSDPSCVRKKEEILLKAKVLLYSTLDE